MQEKGAMHHTAAYYLLMLEYLLLEIRNFEPAEAAYAPKLAYMFHNVPALLNSNFDVKAGEEAYAVIEGRAAALGLSQWLEVADHWVRDMMAGEQHADRHVPTATT